MVTLPFASRIHAAHLLAERLSGIEGDVAVLALPDALPMGRVVSDRLACPLDVVLVRPLQPGGNATPVIGMLDEAGGVRIDAVAGRSGAADADLDGEIRRQRHALEAMRSMLRGDRDPVDLRNRTVIVVDDGIATGATMLAALDVARVRHAAKRICAVPVASSAGLAAVEAAADSVVCLATPVAFRGIDRYYLEPRRPAAGVVRAALADASTSGCRR